MRRTCRALGCEALTTKYGAFCSTHKTRVRRHGAPDQRGVTKADLKPYLVKVRERIGKNEGLAIWALLDQRWLSLVEHSDRTTGGIRNTWSRKAAEELRKLAGAVGPRTIVETVLAVYLMQEMAGHRFKSDRAFNTQLTRRLRGLTERNAHFSISKATGRTKRAYSEVPPRVTAVMAEMVNASLGVAGVWFARQYREHEERLSRANTDLHEGLAEIDFG